MEIGGDKGVKTWEVVTDGWRKAVSKNGKWNCDQSATAARVNKWTKKKM